MERKDRSTGNGVDGWLAMHHRNLDALNNAAKRAAETAHAIAIEHFDFVSEAHRCLADLLLKGLRSGANEDGSAYLKLARDVVENALSRNLAMTEMTTQLRLDGLAILKQNVSDTFELLQPILGDASRRRGDAG
jgi:hypothetical protein